MSDIIDIPEAATLLPLFSPPFPMHPPQVRGLDLVPESALLGMKPAWNVPLFPERRARISILEDVYIAEEGLVFDKSCRVFRETITQHTVPEIARGQAATRAAIAQELPAEPGTFILCKKRGCGNYGHWLLEMLPKAFLARLHVRLADLRYIVPAANGQLARTINDSLALLQIDADQVLAADSSPRRIERLLVVDGLTAHGSYMSPLVLNCTDTLAARVEGAKPSKLYVTRRGIPSRRFVNEAAIEQQARACGYTMIDTSEMSFAQQITAFRNASHIVGIIGAAMTNIVFAPGHAEIVNLVPASMPDTFFWFIAGLKRQTYRELRCRQIGPIKGVLEWDTDIEIDQSDLDDLFPYP